MCKNIREVSVSELMRKQYDEMSASKKIQVTFWSVYWKIKAKLNMRRKYFEKEKQSFKKRYFN